MEMKTINKNPRNIVFMGLLIFTFAYQWGLASAEASGISNKEKLNYLAVHLEVGAFRHPWYKSIAKTGNSQNLEYQKALWPSLINMIKLADSYNFKLTLYMNPQWGELIMQDSKKLSLLKSWIQHGHELAFHHHGLKHPDWNGFSNLKEAKVKPEYRGTAEEGFFYVKNLIPNYKVTTGTLTDWQTDTHDPINTFTWGGVKRGEKFEDSLSGIKRVKYKGKKLNILRHGLLGTEWNDEHFSRTKRQVEMFIKMHKKRSKDEIYGVVTHLHDFHRRPQSLETLFGYLKRQKESIVTVKRIVNE